MMILFAYLALGLVGFVDNMRGASYPLILERFQVTSDIGSSFFWLASAVGIVVSFNVSKLEGKIKDNYLLALFIFLLFCGSLGIGLVAILSLSFNYLYLPVICVGAAMSGVGVLINGIITDYSPIEKRQKNLSILHSMYGISSLGSPLILKFFLKLNYDWPYIFILVAFLALGFSLQMVIKKTDSLLEKKSSGKMGLNETEGKFLSKEAKNTIDYLQLGFFSLMFTFYTCSEIYVSSRMVDLFYNTFHYDLQESNSALAIFFGFLLLGRITFGIFNVPGKPHLWLWIGLISSCLFIFLSTKGYEKLLPLCGFSLSWFFPLGMEILKRTMGEYAKYATGKILAVVGIGLMLMHLLVGQLNAHFGGYLVLQLSIVLPLSSLLCLMVLQVKYGIHRH